MEKYMIFIKPARTILLSLFLSLSFLVPTPAVAKHDFLKKEEVAVAEKAEASSPVKAELVAFGEPKAGEPYYVGIRLNIQDGWSTYWKNPGEAGYPLSIEWTLPDGYQVEELLWPTPEKSVVQNMVVYGYSNQVTLLAKIKPGKTNATIQANVKWLVCNDETCLPGEADLTLAQGAPADLGHALKKIPQELAEATIQDTQGDKVVLLVPNQSYEHKPKQVEFYPEDEALKDSLKFWHDPSKGSFLEIPKTGNNLKGVIEFTNEAGHSQAFNLDLSLKKSSPLQFSSDVYDETFASFLMILAFAFIGGIILNLMPCVLPVVSLKVLSFMNMAGSSRRKTMLHGALFSAGVLVSFWALAGVILALRGLGHSVGWGFQLQNEAFVGILAALLLILALWLFGVFEIGFKLSAKSGDMVEKAKKNDNGKMFGSFLSGVLATAVATPCSGPFLGTALGVAVTVPALQSLTIFTFLGLGMASPYILLAAFPKLLRFLPKPGAWMETFKQLMGFMMLLVVVWLTWVFVAQSDASTILPLLIGFLLISFGAWTYGKLTFGIKKKITKVALLSITLLATGSGFYHVVDAGRQSVMMSAQPIKLEKGWEAFSTDAIAKLREEGKGVFVDFTAKWCLLCQANLIVLNMPNVEQKMVEMGVVRMMADWTKSDPSITAELAKFGRNSVPLYIYYPPGKDSKPLVLPQVLTQDVVLDSLVNNDS